jgi:hypothetical protein
MELRIEKEIEIALQNAAVKKQQLDLCTDRPLA